MRCNACDTPMLTAEDLQRVLDGIETAIAIVDHQIRIEWANAHFRQWFSPQEGTVEGAFFYKVLGDPQLEGPSFAPFQEAASTSSPVRTNLVLPSERHVQLEVKVFDRDEAGAVSRFLARLEDVTEEWSVAERIERIYRAGAELSAIRPDWLSRMHHEERLAWVKLCINNHLQGLFRFDAVEIRRLDRRTGQLVRLLSIGMKPDAEARAIRPGLEGSGITGYVAATGNTYICEDTSLDPRYLPGAEGARSSLTVPLLFENEVVGTFNVESSRRAAFTQEDARFLQIYCRELARALVMLELLEEERHLGSACKVEEVHRRIADPVDEIYSELVRLQKACTDTSLPSSAELQDSLGTLIKHAESLKKIVWEMGQELPPTMAVPPIPPTQQASALSGKHILVVVGDFEPRMQIRRVLQQLGAVVSAVRTGQGGLVLLDHETFDLVIVQLHLPDMESKEFLDAAIRQKGFSPHRLVLMSEYGYDPHHNLVAARTMGVQAVFLKEKLCDQLVPTCLQSLSPPRSSAPSSAASA